MPTLLSRFLMISILLVTPMSLGAHARDLSSLKKLGVIRLAADGATPGFNYFKDNQLVGFEIDLAEEMARRLGLKPEWKVAPFNSLLIGLDQEQFDLVVTSHAITPERKNAVDFVSPHYCTSAVIVSKENGPKKVSELNGKVVSVALGTVYFEHLKKMTGIKEVRTLPTELEGLQNLLMNRSDAWVTEKFVAIHAIQSRPEAHLILGESLFNQANAMAVKRGNRSLLDEVNRQLKDLLADGTFDRFRKKYFNQEIRCP